VVWEAELLANPDLPRRFELSAELNAADAATMYGGGAKWQFRLGLISSMVCCRRHHSVRNDFTGSANAAFIAWKPTVSSAIPMTEAPAARNIQPLSGVR
jgi:hypothetical protein